ncbi:MAG: hypothetical protein GC152_11270 [Alphaproteobacteria bacterium]|nr:hypothetical protein [Alphaproteobacteria bacterium]
MRRSDVHDDGAPRDNSRKKNLSWQWASLGTVALLAILAVAIVVARVPIANAAIGWLLAGGRFGEADVNITELGLKATRIGHVDWRDRDGNSFAGSNVLVSYDIAALIAGRRVGRISAEELKIDIEKLPAASRGDRTPKSSTLPFDSIYAPRISLSAKTPFGALRGDASIDFSFVAGGIATLDVSADDLSSSLGQDKNLEAESASVLGRAEFRPEGELVATVEAQCKNLAIWRAGADMAIVSATGRASSWRSAFKGDFSKLSGDADITIAPTHFRLAADHQRDGPDAESWVEAFLVEMLSGGVALQGQASVAFAEGSVTASAPDGAVQIDLVGPGSRLVLTQRDNEPLLRIADGAGRMVAAMRSEGKAPGDLSVVVNASSLKTASFSVVGELQKGGIGAIAWGRSEAGLDGAIEGDVVSADFRFLGEIDRASFGRMDFSNASFDASLKGRADLTARTATAKIVGGCASLRRGSIAIASQDLSASVRDAQLCEGAEPLIALNWRDKPKIDAAGRLTASSGAFSIAQTSIEGVPPSIQFSANYSPAEHLTAVSATLSGGEAVLNGALGFSSIRGEGSALLTSDEELKGDVKIASADLRQVGENAIASPMKASGSARLADQVIDFEFGVASLLGAPLGAGAGRHNVATGVGSAEFDTGALALAPGELQPSAFSPYFVGLLSNAVGKMAAEFKFGWTPSGVDSSGFIELEDVSFQGPTLAVSRTFDVDGRIALSSLLPLKTPGLQDISVGLVDLDALQLESGLIAFEFPGDDTIRLDTAEFEWFDGVVGAYDAISPLGAGRVEFDLRAAGVDFAVLLSRLNVDGLSGEGVVEGVLPLVIEDGRASIENGELRSVGAGILRYNGPPGTIEETNAGAKIAFEALRRLEFTLLSATINGPLDGVLDFDLRFEGASALTVDDPRVKEPVRFPIVYRMNIKAPALDLIREGRAAIDFTTREGGLGETLKRLEAEENAESPPERREE